MIVQMDIKDLLIKKNKWKFTFPQCKSKCWALTWTNTI